jgi:transposase
MGKGPWRLDQGAQIKPADLDRDGKAVFATAVGRNGPRAHRSGPFSAGGPAVVAVMALEEREARVFGRPGATDMRKQINGLALIVEQQMESNVFEGALFLFCNGEPRRNLKALYLDRTGFCLWQKCLEKHRFPWPRNAEQARCETDSEKLRSHACYWRVLSPLAAGLLTAKSNACFSKDSRLGLSGYESLRADPMQRSVPARTGATVSFPPRVVALKNLQSSPYFLLPSIDASLISLNQARAALARTFQMAAGVEVLFESGNVTGPARTDVSLTVTSMIQEGMTNALRHGKAKRVRILLWIDKETLIVILLDNGCGVVELVEGIGLAGMRESMEAVSGS